MDVLREKSAEFGGSLFDPPPSESKEQFDSAPTTKPDPPSNRVNEPLEP